jgi:RimJ/RimL family protein N-acetyltransferase
VITESERLILRKFKDSDLDTLLKYRNDPDVSKYDGWQQELTLDKASQFISDMKNINLYTDTDWMQIAFELKENNLHIGDCGFRRFDNGKQAEIGIRLDREFWGEGYAFEGLSAIFTFAFSNFGINRIIAIADTRNKGSINLLTRLGMRNEGHHIESYYNNDHWTDEFSFAILRREWK